VVQIAELRFGKLEHGAVCPFAFDQLADRQWPKAFAAVSEAVSDRPIKPIEKGLLLLPIKQKCRVHRCF
jgi:hypothetical protein